jgi:CheY-like chemotaxis protein
VDHVARFQLKKMLVLYVDDDPEDCELFCEVISFVQTFRLIPEGMTLKCMIARDGLDALDILTTRSVAPDVIFSDINMPMMDGREFVKQLKGHKLLSDVPVYMFSTSFNDEDILNFHRLGVAGCLKKPNGFNEFARMISTVLEQLLGI